MEEKNNINLKQKKELNSEINSNKTNVDSEINSDKNNVDSEINPKTNVVSEVDSNKTIVDSETNSKTSVDSEVNLFKINFLYVGIALIFLVLAFTGYFYLFDSRDSFEFEIERNQVFFQSNLNPQKLIQDFSSQQNFLLLIETQEQGQINQDLINSGILLNSVFVFNEKKIVLLFKIINPDSNELLSCETNKGNALEQITLTPLECVDYLNELNLTELIILFPDLRKQKASVLLEENKFTIKPSTSRSALIASQTLLELLFENNQEALNKINELASQIYN